MTGLATSPSFEPLTACWICGGADLEPYCRCRMDFREYATQDPELTAYTGEHVWLARCRACGFGQPQALPALDRFFDRMYDQRWSDEWVANESSATYKDLIFRSILRQLAVRVPPARRRLLDVGAHAGRFMWLAQQAGWMVEGIELNPRTAAAAEARTGATVHRINAHDLVASGRHWDAVVLTDVLEHIPDPQRLLAALAALVEPGGVLAVKVPNGAAQWVKERWLARLTSHQPTLADNLVHVNHFSPESLALALERAGFARVTITTAPPELPPGAGVRSRLGLWAAGRLPGALHTPAALHLQAFGEKRG
jgi:SAM-dependent methyltransferase